MRRGLITQIGSLPHEDVRKAVEYSLRHDIPFLPELPRRGEKMLDYIKRPGKLSCLDEFKKHEYATVKIQCVGPATLILSGYNEDESVIRPYEHIRAVLDGLVAEEVILFLDEPALWRADFDYMSLWESLFTSFDVVAGVHTCGDISQIDLASLRVEIISFDASRYDVTKCPGYGHHRRGQKVAWGIREVENVKDFKEGDLLTWPCGMSPDSYSVEDCEKNLENLIKISRDLPRRS